MTDKFTPGPWRSISHGSREVQRPYVISETGIILADCNAESSDGENEANARLIAAAPDMFRALEHARFVIGIFVSEDYPDFKHEDYPAFFADIDAALAKARGEEAAT